VLAVAVVLLAACQSALAAASLTPLPRSDYRVSPVCPAPSPGRSSCLALALVPVTREALAHTHPLAVARTSPLKAPSPAAGNYGLRPQDIRSAYKLPSSPASPQTIAIVDAYNDPNAESDLKAYDQEFGLLECTAANGCLRLVNQYGETGHPPFPKTAAELEQAHLGTISEAETAETATGWGVELSLDMEAAHSTCQQCKIILVLANSEANSDLEAAERTAESLGANEITNSWGGLEEGESAELEASSPFNHPGTVITASAGDDGYLSWDSGEQGLAEFPASSPHVVAVGGTRLSLTTEGEWSSESVWNGDGATGGGCSVNFRAPAWQLSLADWSTVGCGEKRAVADVAAVADPYTGFAVHYTSPACEYVYQKTVEYWCTIGGTSLASPVIAGVFALAGGSGSIPYPARTLYENAVRKPSALHDVQSGSNGRCTLGFNEATGLSSCTLAEEGASCASKAICVAGAGYDGPTGVGTPDGIAAFKASSEGAGSEPEQPGSGEGTGHVESGGTHTEASGAPESAPPTTTPAAPSEVVRTPVSATTEISGLSLTLHAVLALNTARPRISQVGFVFDDSRAGRVRIALTRRARSHRWMAWAGVARVETVYVPAGRTSRRLAGGAALRNGLYRLTVTPAGGTVKSLLFQIG
jgi:hypothetical protein